MRVAPARADSIEVRHHDDTVTRHDGGVLYYLHKSGVDIVDEKGDYVARYTDVVTTVADTDNRNAGPDWLDEILAGFYPFQREYVTRLMAGTVAAEQAAAHSTRD